MLNRKKALDEWSGFRSPRNIADKFDGLSRGGKILTDTHLLQTRYLIDGYVAHLAAYKAVYEENYGISFEKYASRIPTSGGEMIYVFNWRASSMMMELFNKCKKYRRLRKVIIGLCDEIIGLYKAGVTSGSQFYGLFRQVEKTWFYVLFEDV